MNLGIGLLKCLVYVRLQRLKKPLAETKIYRQALFNNLEKDGLHQQITTPGQGGLPVVLLDLVSVCSLITMFDLNKINTDNKTNKLYGLVWLTCHFEFLPYNYVHLNIKAYF